MKMLRTTVTVALLAIGSLAGAQVLADVMLSTAIASQLYPGVHLPSGSLRAEGPGAATFVATLPDVSGFGSWEVYTATGLAANLEPAFVRNVTNAFAVAGLFESERSQRTIDGAVHTRMVFSDGTDEAILYVVAGNGVVTWAVGRKAG